MIVGDVGLDLPRPLLRPRARPAPLALLRPGPLRPRLRAARPRLPDRLRPLDRGAQHRVLPRADRQRQGRPGPARSPIASRSSGPRRPSSCSPPTSEGAADRRSCSGTRAGARSASGEPREEQAPPTGRAARAGDREPAVRPDRRRAASPRRRSSPGCSPPGWSPAPSPRRAASPPRTCAAASSSTRRTPDPAELIDRGDLDLIAIATRHDTHAALAAGRCARGSPSTSRSRWRSTREGLAAVRDAQAATRRAAARRLQPPLRAARGRAAQARPARG